MQLREKRKMYNDSLFRSISIKRPPDKVSAYAVQSQMGKIIRRPNKPNQDSYFIIKNPMEIENGYLFGVMDGHGSFGKEASSLVKTRLPMNLSLPNSTHKSSDIRNSFLSDQNFRKTLVKSAYERTNKELNSSSFDSSYSGTTSVTVFTHDSLLLCANVGDSRAVIASLQDLSKDQPRWEVRQITIDHKPELQDEHQRILMCNGRVEAFRGKLPIKP